MKLYYFMIIAIGLMFTFSIAGVDTGSNRIINTLGMGVNSLNETVITPSLSAASTYNIRDIINQNSWWLALVGAFAVAISLGAIKGVSIFGGGAQLDPLNAIMAAVAAYIYFMFSFDFLSILLYMFEITNGVGWQFNLTWILIVPFLFAFAFSIIQFIRGTE